MNKVLEYNQETEIIFKKQIKIIDIDAAYQLSSCKTYIPPFNKMCVDRNLISVYFWLTLTFVVQGIDGRNIKIIDPKTLLIYGISKIYIRLSKTILQLPIVQKRYQDPIILA